MKEQETDRMGDVREVDTGKELSSDMFWNERNDIRSASNKHGDRHENTD